MGRRATKVDVAGWPRPRLAARRDRGIAGARRHYASPEQLRGETITVASDVYSLGVLSYELLSGSTPYAPKRGSLAALEEAVLEGEAALASLRTTDPAAAKARKVRSIRFLRRRSGATPRSVMRPPRGSRATSSGT